MPSLVPILKMDEFLIVTLQVEIDDQIAIQLREDLANQVRVSGARGVILDISTLDVVDSFIARILSSIASVAQIMDAETVIVGMQPMVALTLVELGLELPHLQTALNLEKGLTLLQNHLKSKLPTLM